MKDNQLRNSEFAIGIWYSLAAYVLWGLLPLYWKALKVVPPSQILAHRIFWSFSFVMLMLMFTKKAYKILEVLRQKTCRRTLLASAILISGNWFIYIWAVNSGRVIEASLGYYINPLLTVVMGMLFLNERLNFWQSISLGLASLGVLIITLGYGRLPWIAFVLALSFALYGLAKKKVPMDSLTALTLETGFAAPFALGFLIIQQVKGVGVVTSLPMNLVALLIFSGIVTALPLFWFAKGAERIPLSTIGFLQFLAPSLSLLLGIFVFGEVFTTIHMISFSFIWLAVTLFSLSNSKLLTKWQPAKWQPELPGKKSVEKPAKV